MMACHAALLVTRQLVWAALPCLGLRDGLDHWHSLLWRQSKPHPDMVR